MILEMFGEPGCLIPANVDEYFALQLARRLGDEQNIRRYVTYSRQFNQKELLGLYEEARTGPSDGLVQRFNSLFIPFEP